MVGRPIRLSILLPITFLPFSLLSHIAIPLPPSTHPSPTDLPPRAPRRPT
jgi:hypothetical protein